MDEAPPNPGALSSSSMDVDGPFLSSGLSSASLKRRASPSFADEDNGGPLKRLKEEDFSAFVLESKKQHVDTECQLARELVDELQCPCCSALAHRPVVVIPCQHMFCGRYGFYAYSLFFFPLDMLL